MSSKILPMGSMMVGFIGATSSSVPAIAILSSSSLRSRPMFQTMANLALSETWFLFCTGVIGMINVVGGKMTPTVCAAFQSHNVSVGISSTTALLVLSMERFVAVIYGLRYETILSPRRMRFLLLFPWFVWSVCWAIFTSLSSAMILQNFGPSPLHCRFMEVMPTALKLAATGTATVICTIIVAMNILVSRVAVRHQRAIREQRHMVGLASQENVNAYWGVLRVTVIYILFQTPANLLFLLELLWKPQPPGLSALSTVFVILIFAIDGWFFGFFNTTLRRRYAELFGCWSPVEPAALAEAPRSSSATAGIVHVVGQQQKKQQQQQRGGSAGRTQVAPIKSGSPAQNTEHAEAGRAAIPIWVVPPVPVHIIGEGVPQVHVAMAAEAAPQLPVQVKGKAMAYGEWCGELSAETAPTLALVSQLQMFDADDIEEGKEILGALP